MFILGKEKSNEGKYVDDDNMLPRYFSRIDLSDNKFKYEILE